MRAIKIIVVGAGLSLAFGLPSHAQDIGKDLKTTIVLQGSPCDQVAKQTRNGDSDYNVTCNDGNRYRVFVDGNGRVVVQKI